MVANQVSSNRLFHKVGSSCLTRRSAVSASPHRKKKARYPITPEQRVMAARLRRAKQGDPVFLEIENRIYQEVVDAGGVIDRDMFLFWGKGRRRNFPGWVKRELDTSSQCAAFVGSKDTKTKKMVAFVLFGTLRPSSDLKECLKQFRTKQARRKIVSQHIFDRLFVSFHESTHVIDFSKNLSCNWKKDLPIYKKDFSSRLINHRSEILADTAALIRLADMIGLENARKFISYKKPFLASILTTSPMHDSLSCFEKALGWYERALDKGALKHGCVTLGEAARLASRHIQYRHRSGRLEHELVASEVLYKMSLSRNKSSVSREALLSTNDIKNFYKPQIIRLALKKAIKSQAVCDVFLGETYPDYLQTTIAFLQKQKALTP